MNHPLGRSMAEKILFIPSVRKGNGYGHISRCIETAERLPESWIFQEPVEHALKIDFHRRLSAWEDIDQGWDLIVVDRRETGLEMYTRLSKLAPVLLIDDTGAARVSAFYLLDILPNLDPHRPNLCERRYLELPSPKLEPDQKGSKPRQKKILISMGGEDFDRLGPRIAHALAALDLDDAIYLLQGPMASYNDVPESVTLLPAEPGLRNRLSEYSLVICSIGLTAYEAAAAGADVLLLGHSRYHVQLGKIEGFPSFSSIEELVHYIKTPEVQPKPRYRFYLENHEDFSMVDFLAQADSLENASSCPSCGSDNRRVLQRFPERTFFSCLNCSMEYQIRFTSAGFDYGKEYFFEEYAKQYGKTYLEDMDVLRSHAGKRLACIQKISKPGVLLDIGAAYGAFLVEARQKGWDVYGTDISEEACAYLRDELGLPSVAGDFLSIDEFGSKSFDLITLWYVIEHFRDLRLVFSKIDRILRSGGILAFSTPNGRGISRKKNPAVFFEKSPKDHYSIWSVKNVSRVLALHGYQVKKIRVTGHHPERFPGIFGRKSLYWITLQLSKFFKLGDTFEVYAEKQ
jgi:SAM-dependent methyltransferase